MNSQRQMTGNIGEWRKDNPLKNTKKKKKCRMCGDSFMPTGARKFLCSWECRKASKLLVSRKANARYIHNHSGQ